MLNSCNPISGESLLQYVVRGQHIERVELMLGAECRLGMIQDAQGHTALKIALKYKQQTVVKMLLDSMLSNAAHQANAFEPFMRHRVEIAQQYPGIFLSFIKETRLIPEESLAPTGQLFA